VEKAWGKICGNCSTAAANLVAIRIGYATNSIPTSAYAEAYATSTTYVCIATRVSSINWLFLNKTYMLIAYTIQQWN
jgi:hypothetical protein